MKFAPTSRNVTHQNTGDRRRSLLIAGTSTGTLSPGSGGSGMGPGTPPLATSQQTARIRVRIRSSASHGLVSLGESHVHAAESFPEAASVTL